MEVAGRLPPGPGMTFTVDQAADAGSRSAMSNPFGHAA